jgi:hypothetical protein
MFKRLCFLLLVPAICFGQGSQLPKYKVAHLPAPATMPTGTVQVIDGISASDCTAGGGHFNVICIVNGGTWTASSGSGGGGVNPSPQFSVFYQPSPGTTATAQGDPNATTDGSGHLTTVGNYNGGVVPPAGFNTNIAAFPAYYNPNTAINIMAAGAKGDCVTDDHDAIMRAQAIAGLSTPPLTLKIPRAPGGCFLTSTLTWQGLSQDGEPTGMGNNFSNGSNPISSKLKSMPGQDLWNFPDWASGTTTIFSKSPKISHIQWVVDDSVDSSASHPHRKPGRTQVDFVTTAGSRAITSATIQCSGGDVGQGLLLTYPDTTTQSMVVTSCTTSTGLWGNGMNGAYGTNLTMASVTPVASTRATLTQGSNVIVVTSATGIANGQVVVMNTLPTNLETTVTNVSGTSITLSNYTQCVQTCSALTIPVAFYDPTAAQATESHTGVTGYLSFGGIPVTETMGACALCIDDHDATTAGVPYAIMNGAHFEDFNITTTSGTAINKTVAIGAQGLAGAFYSDNFIHGRIFGFTYGIINYPQDTNTTNAQNGGDQNTYRDLIVGCTHPITIYNSSYSRINDIQISGTGNTGFHLLQSHNTNAEPSNVWTIDISEIEQGTGTVNMRLEGYGHTVNRFNASSQGITVWDASASICTSCAPRGSSTGFQSSFLVNGTQNIILLADGVNQLLISGDPIDGNRVTGLRQTSTSGGNSVWTRQVTFLGRGCSANDRTADFLNGSAATPFLNMCDLWFWPVDNFLSSGGHPVLVDDPTSETGMYSKVTTNESIIGTSSWPSNKWIIGSTAGQKANLPAKSVTIQLRVKCPSIVSFTMDPAVYTGTSTLVHDFGAQAVTCSTSYTTQSITVDLTPYGGGVNWLRLSYGGVTGNEVDSAWIGISPQIVAGALSPSGVTGQVWTQTGVSTQGWSGSTGVNTAIPAWTQFFGDGSDGALSCSSGNTAISGEKWYTTVSVTGTCNLVCTRQTPCIIRASTSITISANLWASFNSAVANSGGSGSGNAGGSAGGSGGGAAAGTTGSSGFDSTGGGTAGAITGGNGGDATNGIQSASVFGDIRKLLIGSPMLFSTNATSAIWSACGGGGLAGGSSGGAAGTAGCFIALIAPTVNISGLIDVTGTRGGDAAANSTGAGSGGGGGGLLIRSPALTNTATINLAGGPGGGCVNPAIVLQTPTAAGLSVTQNATTQAQAHVSTFAGGNPTVVTVDRGGSGYTYTPNCAVVGTGGGGNTGSGATCTATVAAGVVTGITVTGGNAGYGTGTAYTTCGFGGSGWQGWDYIFAN